MALNKSAACGGTGPFHALIVIFHQPVRTFAALELRKAAWLPCVLLMIATTVLLSWYCSIVDFAWLNDDLAAGVRKADEQEQMKAMLNKQLFQTRAIAGSLVMLLLPMAVLGAYFQFVGKILNRDMSFASGFALSAWSSVPALLSFPIGAVQILLSPDGQLAMYELNPLSLNYIFFQHETWHPMAGLLDSVSVQIVWSIVLMVIGFQVWGKVALSTAVKVVLIPYATIYGLWLAVALSRASAV